MNEREAMEAMEFERLSGEEQNAVKAMIEAARQDSGRHTIDVKDSGGTITGDAYAFQIVGKGVLWGFNRAPSYFNVARGLVSF